MGLNFIAYSEDIHDLFMANQPHEMLTFPRVEGHEMPCLLHDMAMEFFMGVSALFHRIVPSSGADLRYDYARIFKQLNVRVHSIELEQEGYS